MKKKYYVYALFDLNEFRQITLDEINISILYKPYYIGKGCGERICKHKKIKNTRHKKDAKTKSLFNLGYKYEEIALILKDNLSEIESYELEKLLIKKIGLHNLTNITPGGLGGFGSHRGKTYAEIYGEERGKEIATKISKANLGNKNTEESNLKHSKTLKEKFKNDEQYRVRHSNGQRGKKMPEEFSKMQSEKLNGKSYNDRYGDDKSKEIREKQSLSAKGKKQTDKHKYNAAKSRAKYLWNITFYGIEYLGLLRCEFIKITGKCPYRCKEATRVENK